ncbi:hypothetical protein BDW69DRAFT_109339 [Aspergillus filifer]
MRPLANHLNFVLRAARPIARQLTQVKSSSASWQPHPFVLLGPLDDCPWSKLKSLSSLSLFFFSSLPDWREEAGTLCCPAFTIGPPCKASRPESLVDCRLQAAKVIITLPCYSPSCCYRLSLFPPLSELPFSFSSLLSLLICYRPLGLWFPDFITCTKLSRH